MISFAKAFLGAKYDWSTRSMVSCVSFEAEVALYQRRMTKDSTISCMKLSVMTLSSDLFSLVKSSLPKPYLLPLSVGDDRVCS